MHCFSRAAHGKLQAHRQTQTAWKAACTERLARNGLGFSALQRFSRTPRPPAKLAVRALPSLDADTTVAVVSALKGPTLSELLSYGQAALSFAGAAWQAAIAPFAIFGTDRWGLNLLFYFAVLLMGYNLIVQAPKQ
ncbi:hypothetical protein PLESTB_001159000 [Pleodorina starrii]|uniref:Uncharacterized protein n=1 Tax=Pleodorina starrii TaxID=330485 RepID=A0A9W6F547_9CHLO|nr:hypothetical protein PLESTB_001159000 [Pleodorina starrii]GLC64716.1 hypothetical protein PLESTF_000199800 [Pleodorina starrii]